MKKQNSKKSGKPVKKARAAAKTPAPKAAAKTVPQLGREQLAARAVALYQEGKKVSEIAVALGYERGHGQNRVANALIAAGVYKGKRKAAA
ncbi:MAG: hypothetical protein ACE14M_11045 [Terriglobales bacterium]